MKSELNEKERQKEIFEKIRKAGSEEYVTEWDSEGNVGKSKKKSEIKKGKKARSSGVGFELKVRRDLEDKGWIVDKWSNNINLKKQEIEPAKRKFNPFSKVMTIGTGFPDFIGFQKMGDYYKVIGVEVKKNGILSKEEKEKCKWYLDNGVFGEVWVAKGVKEGRQLKVVYEDFSERYRKLFN